MAANIQKLDHGLAYICFCQSVYNRQLLPQVSSLPKCHCKTSCLTDVIMNRYWAVIIIAFFFLSCAAAGDAAILPLMASFASVMPQATIQGFEWANRVYRRWRREIAESERSSFAIADACVEKGRIHDEG